MYKPRPEPAIWRGIRMVGVRADKLVKETFLILRRDPQAVVLHFDANHVSLTAARRTRITPPGRVYLMALVT